MAVSYDASTQRLIAVQVFGFSNTPQTSQDVPDISKYLMQVEKPKLPYRLKSYRYKKRHAKSIKGFEKMDLDDGMISYDYKKARKIFRGRRTGIAFEGIPIQQYDSGATTYSNVPNRRNGLYEFNGELSKPIYRSRLFKPCRRANRDYRILLSVFGKNIGIKKRPKRFYYRLPSLAYGMEYNVFFIRRKKVATHRTSVKIPGRLFQIEFPKLDYFDEAHGIDTLRKERIIVTYDTLKIRLFYDVGKVKVDSLKHHKILNRLSEFKGEVGVQANAYASIEGEEKSNQRLAKQRMQEFVKFIAPWMDSSATSPRLVTKEQWGLFRKQINGTRFSFLSSLGKQKVRDYVNQHRSDTLMAAFLAEQRHVDFRLIWREEKTELILKKSLEAIYDSLLQEVKGVASPSASLYEALEESQLKYYAFFLKDDSLSKPLLPALNVEQHPEYRYHELLFHVKHLQSINHAQCFKEIQRIGRSRFFPLRLKEQLLFNNLIAIYNAFIQDSSGSFLKNPGCDGELRNEFYMLNRTDVLCTEHNMLSYSLINLPKLIDQAKKVGSDIDIGQLWKYYYLNMIAYKSMFPNKSEAIALLPKFKAYFHPDDNLLSDEERLKYALVYCSLKQYASARVLLEPISLRDNPHIPSLKLYLCVKYVNHTDLHDYANFLISQFHRLGKEDWCDYWYNPYYLNFILLEDLRLKNFYNCNCQNKCLE